MSKIKRTTFQDRFKNAVRAFKGQPISTLYLGMDVKRCDKCEYKDDTTRLKDILRNAIDAYVFELDQHDYESDDEIYSVLLNQFCMNDSDYINIMGCSFKQHR